MDVDANLRDLEAAIGSLEPQTLIVAPEGLLSGYRPQPGVTADLDQRRTEQAIDQALGLAVRAGIHLVVGACVRIDGTWRNASFYLGPDRKVWRYDKVNLATSERPDFTPGNGLPVLDVHMDDRPARLGIQMCREIRYPEQWRRLAVQGAEVIAYVNNAVGSRDGHELWRAHAISRAAEIQRFVVGANNAAPDQTCPTLIISPSGRVLAEAPIGETTIVGAEVDLAEVSDWVISQARADVVGVVSHDA